MKMMKISTFLWTIKPSVLLVSLVLLTLIIRNSAIVSGTSEDAERIGPPVKQKIASGPLTFTDGDKRVKIASLGVEYIEGIGLVGRYGLAAEGGDPNVGFPIWIEAKYFDRLDIKQSLEAKFPRSQSRLPYKDYHTVIHIADTNPVDILWKGEQLIAYAFRCKVTGIDRSSLQVRRFSILADPDRLSHQFTNLIGVPGTRITFNGDPNLPFRFVPGLDLWKGAIDIDPNGGLLIDTGTGFRVSQSKDEHRRFTLSKVASDVDYSSVAMTYLSTPSWPKDIIPEEFCGTWEQVDGTDELMVTPASVIWSQRIAGREETYVSRDCKLEGRSNKIVFIAVPVGQLSKELPSDKEVKVTITLKPGIMNLSIEAASRYEGYKKVAGGQTYVPVKLPPGQIFKPDAKVIMVDEQKKSLYVNIGANDGVWSNLLFAIYGYEQVISLDAKPKAAARISQNGIREESSLAEIMTISPDERSPIKVGDVLVNPIWDWNRANVVVFAGILDLDGDGFEEYGAVALLTAFVRDWGGSVMNKLSVNTNLVILGTKPRSLSREVIIKDLGQPMIATRVYETARERLDHYEQVLSKAQSMQIPVLDLKNFLSIIGWNSGRQE